MMKSNLQTLLHVPKPGYIASPEALIEDFEKLMPHWMQPKFNASSVAESDLSHQESSTFFQVLPVEQ